MGANTPQGFYTQIQTLFAPQNKYHTYIIKASSGSGKSTMMKKIGDAIAKKGHPVEFLKCTADSTSVDAVVCHPLKFAIVDGTFPHVVDPTFPGASEQVLSFYHCVDPEKIKPKLDTLMAASKKRKDLLDQSTRFASAASSLMQSVEKIAAPMVNIKKAGTYAEHLSKQHFPPKKQATGKEQVRFLSAITNEGAVFLEDTIEKIAETTYVFQDEHGYITPKILNALRKKALANGYDIISCYHHWNPKRLEHLFIPTLKLAFVTSGPFHKISIKPFRTVHAKRFYDLEKLQLQKAKLRFYKKAIAVLSEKIAELHAAVQTQQEIIEQCYIPAIDFTDIDAATNHLIETYGK